MREQVAGGRAVPPASALIARIQAVARGAEAPEPPAGFAAAPLKPAAKAPTAAGSRDAEDFHALSPTQRPAAPIEAVAPTTPAAPCRAGDWRQRCRIAGRRRRRRSLALPPLFIKPAAPVPPGREPVAGAERGEMARVSAELLDELLNHAGEVSITRARLEQQLGLVDFNLAELSRTVTRLKEQLRKLEIETEAQVLHRHDQESDHRQGFDPLELDRYSSIQQYSRALAESASDVASLQQLLEGLVAETQNQLQLQARTVTELQNGLMRTRMVSFQRHVQRLARIVRQAAADTGKRAELVVEGAAGELDRQVLERMLPPFEHLLRNAVVHGIEPPEERRAHGKAATGQISLQAAARGLRGHRRDQRRRRRHEPRRDPQPGPGAGAHPGRAGTDRR